MESIVFTLACFGIVAVLLAINYVMVTIQERRHGKTPGWTPEQIDWDAAADDFVQEYLMQGDQINAIKRYRNLTNVGLAEAKYVIDHIVAHPDEMGEKKKAPRPELDDAPGVRDLLDEGRDDEAIDLYRRFAGVDEYTARAAVERIKRGE